MTFTLTVHTGHGPERYVGNFLTYEEARDTAVSGHDDEWVWVPQHGYWYHGGGNAPGQSFYIRETAS